MRYCSFSGDHFQPPQTRLLNVVRTKKGNKLVSMNTSPGYDYDSDVVDETPRQPSALQIVNRDFFDEEDIDLLDDPFGNPDLLPMKGDKKIRKRNNVVNKARQKQSKSDEDSDESSQSDSDSSDDSEDSDDGGDDLSSNIDDNDDDSEEGDSDDTGEEDDDDDDEDSDSDDESDDDSDDSDNDSDEVPDTDDDENDDAYSDDDDDDDDDDEDDDDEDDEDDDDDDDVDDDTGDEDDDSSDEDDDDDDDDDDDNSDDEDDDEEEDNDEDSIDDGNEQEPEPFKVPYGAPRRGNGNSKNSSNFTAQVYKGGFDESQNAAYPAMSLTDNFPSRSYKGHLSDLASSLFGGSTINASESSSLQPNLTALTLRDFLNPVKILSSGPSENLEYQKSTSFLSWLKSPEVPRPMQKNEDLRLFK